MALTEIRRLLQIAEKPSRLIIGLMSGTSLDGLDIAFCRMHGSGRATRVEVLQFETIPYQDSFRESIREVFAKKQVDLGKLCLLNALIAEVHAALILEALKKWGIEAAAIDCIASHGQTIFHAPARHYDVVGMADSTLQLGDGDHIAVRTGIITLSDFRQKHIAGGGEGAPLALYGDYLLFSSPEENRILLNIGGIANFTFLPAAENPLEMLATDTGPGNTLIDACMKVYFGTDYDKDGETASSGTVSIPLLRELMRSPFLDDQFPKTTGPELFNLAFVADAQQRSGTLQLAPNDLVATLTRFTAVSLTDAIRSLGKSDLTLYVTGGGAHNRQLVTWITELLPDAIIKDFAGLGVHPDAKEAVLFAVLANETLAGEVTQLGNNPRVTMGKISLPDR